MALSAEIFRELEDVVGPAYASNDPAILATYQFPLNVTSIHLGPFNSYTPRGGAVLLPSTVEEVSRIVKICNKYKLKYKASSTFWGAMGYPSHDDSVQLDMRRMDRVLEIDKKNMYAIVEPYIIGVNLQADAMRVGLNTHIIGAGGSCSPLASATSYTGPGPDTISMGNGDENLLALEWVDPTGEIVRTGSLGAGLGWFCGEGPGPGIRSMTRGAMAARGAMGVYTKCAIKLYPWPGPTTLPIEGNAPIYRAVLPPNIRCYTLAFPSWKTWADCAHKIWNSGIGYIAHRQFNMFGRDLKYAMIKILTDPDKTLSDLEEMVKDPEIQKINKQMEREFQIILAGMTPRDMEWQEKALDQMLAETGGWKVAAMNDPQIEGWALAYLIRLGHKNLNLVFAGGYEGCFGNFGPPDYGSSFVEELTDLKKKWEKKGAVVEAGGDAEMGGLGGMGGGAYVMWENFTCWDPHDKASVEGTFEFFEASSKYALSKGWGAGMERGNQYCRGSDGREYPKEKREQIYSKSPSAQTLRYQQKIKEAFNPNDLGDAHYMALEAKA